MSTIASPVTGNLIRRARSSIVWGPVALLAVGAGCYFLLADDLAFLTRLLVIALFVLSLDLVVGFCGVATLGHAALFGAGAYAAGIACIGGVTDPILLLLVGASAGTLMGCVSGALIARFSGLPQIVVSIAIVQLVHQLANKASSYTGGSDGLSGIAPGPVLGLFAFDFFGRTAYIFTLAVVFAVMVLLIVLVRSPFGLLCRGIKEDALRVRFMGASAYGALVKMYTISGGVAGVAGGLAVVTTGVVALDSVSFERSAEGLIMLALGGTGTLYGALLGTAVFQTCEYIISAANPFHWLMMVGFLLLGVVLFLPNGLQGLAFGLVRLFKRVQRQP